MLLAYVPDLVTAAHAMLGQLRSPIIQIFDVGQLYALIVCIDINQSIPCAGKLM